MYTTEKKLKEHVMRNAAVHGVTLAPDKLNRWVAAIATKLKQRKQLLTDRQFADQRAQRKFVVGDYAKYVGPTRDERTGAGVVKREHGQLGRIVEVQQADKSLIITFRPLPDVMKADETLVELVVRDGTPGFWDLERDPRTTA